MNFTTTAFSPNLNLAPNAFRMTTGGFGGFSGFNPMQNPMQMAALQGIGNFGAQLMGQQNANASAQAALNTASTFRDIDFGSNLFAMNKDIFEQKDMPRYFDRYRVNDPFYRQDQLRQNLPELAGRYGRFGAFVA